MTTRPVSRRVVLGVAVLGLAACGKHPKRTKVGTAAVPPDEAALQRARDGEQLLIASYDAMIQHAKRHERPLLEVQRAIHAAHLGALRSARPDGADIAVVANLPHALRVSGHDLRALALAATNGTNAALLASIAASHEASAT